MKLSRAVTYGLSGCAHLASAPVGEVVSNATICDAYQMPHKFVLQIMRLLVSAGIVKAPAASSAVTNSVSQQTRSRF